MNDFHAWSFDKYHQSGNEMITMDCALFLESIGMYR